MASEDGKYRLSVAGFSGDTGDAIAAPARPLRVANGMKFSTPDQDNDNNSGRCDGGIHGWWFNNCARSQLNTDGNGVWNADTDSLVQDVQFARMMLKLQ